MYIVVLFLFLGVQYPSHTDYVGRLCRVKNTVRVTVFSSFASTKQPAANELKKKKIQNARENPTHAATVARYSYSTTRVFERSEGITVLFGRHTHI